MRSKMLEPKCLGKLWYRRRRTIWRRYSGVDYGFGTDKTVVVFVRGSEIWEFDGVSQRQLNAILDPAPMKLFGGQRGLGQTVEAKRSLSEICRELRDGPGPPDVPIKFGEKQ